MKAIKTITFLSFIFLFYHGVFGQEPHLSLKNGDQMNNNVFTEEARSYLFLTPMTKPLNPATPANHPILDASWSMLPDYSDEFNSGTLNQTKWQMDYGWGNTHAQHLNYNSNDNPNCSCNYNNHQFFSYPVNGVNCQGLRFEIRKQTALNRTVEYVNDIQILSDGRKNKRQFNYTSAMIESKHPVDQPYGYFEMRCKIPKARNLIADFWLWNASDGSGINGNTPDQFYNEIDIFETEDGFTCHQTTHYQQNFGTFYDHYKQLSSLDNSYFSDDFNTYAVKWEPNKVIYYINNEILRVVDQHIADHKLNILANIEMDISRGIFTDKQFPVFYDIDYIRVFRRPDYTKPDPIFRINNAKSFNPASPVICYMNSTALLNGVESYSPNNTYFLSVQECNSSGQLTGYEAMDWLDATECQNIDSLNLFTFSQAHGLTMAANKTYRIKLVAGGGDWIEEREYVRILSCSNQTQFTINGKTGPNIEIDYNNGYYDVRDNHYSSGFPVLWLNGKGSDPCDGMLFLSIEPSDANWGRPHPELEKTAWLTTAEITQLYEGKFDLNVFANNKGLPLQFGTYYRVGLSAQNPWTGAAKLLYIKPVTNFIDFSINGDYGTSSGSVVTVQGDDNHVLQNQSNTILHQPALILEGFKSKTSYRIDQPYMISVQLSDANWNRYGTEYTAWYTAEEIRRFDLRTFAAIKGFTMNAGSYYRVSLATNYPWTSKCMLVNIPGCSTLPFFTINGDDRTTYTPTIINRTTNPYGVQLSVWGTTNHPQSGISCYPNKYYYLSVWQCQSDGYTVIGPEYGEWISDDNTLNIGMENGSSTSTLGWFDIQKFALSKGLTLQNQRYYQIRLCTGGTFNCYFRYFKIDDSAISGGAGDEKSGSNDITQGSESTIPVAITVYPNPASGNINFMVSGFETDKAEVKIEIRDILGKPVYYNERFNLSGSLSVAALPRGLYIINITSEKLNYITKFQVVN